MAIITQKTVAIASASALFQSIGPVRPGIVLAHRIAADFFITDLLITDPLVEEGWIIKEGRNAGVRFWRIAPTAKGFFSETAMGNAAVRSLCDCRM